MPDDIETSAPQVGQPGRTEPTEYRPADQWTPIYPVYSRENPRRGEQIKDALPIDWCCPCGTILNGNRSCPKCGLIPGITAGSWMTPRDAPPAARGGCGSG